MAAENGNGALFKNQRKQGSQPDYTGNIEVTVELLQELLKEAMKDRTQPYKARLAAWIKTGGKAGTFLSLSLDAPFEKAGGAAGGTAPARRPKVDDDIPF